MLGLMCKMSRNRDNATEQTTLALEPLTVFGLGTISSMSLVTAMYCLYPLFAADTLSRSVTMQ